MRDTETERLYFQGSVCHVSCLTWSKQSFGNDIVLSGWQQKDKEETTKAKEKKKEKKKEKRKKEMKKMKSKLYGIVKDEANELLGHRDV